LVFTLHFFQSAAMETLGLTPKIMAKMLKIACNWSSWASCSDFLANTFRVLLTAAAYVLMQEMRLHLSPTRHARAQVATLREHFLKLGAQVIVTVRRIVLHLPQAFPYRDSFHRLALSLGAQTG
jgi:hypothetical protein